MPLADRLSPASASKAMCVRLEHGIERQDQQVRAVQCEVDHVTTTAVPSMSARGMIRSGLCVSSAA